MKYAPRPTRKNHLPERDAEVSQRFDEGQTLQRMILEMGLSRTAIQDSLARIKKARGIKQYARAGKPIRERIEEFRVWLFDSANAHADPCLKWLEIFGEERFA